MRGVGLEVGAIAVFCGLWGLFVSDDLEEVGVCAYFVEVVVLAD